MKGCLSGKELNIESFTDEDINYFLNKVNRDGPYSNLTGDKCHIWLGCFDDREKGYGLFNRGSLKNIKAHRVSYTIANGKVPSGVLVCHKCNNSHCVNPDHLYLGTPKDNSDDTKISGYKPERKVILPKEAIDLMGKISDRQIAIKFNIDQTVMHNRRKELGIPKASYVDYCKREVPIAEYKHLLGKIPDIQIEKITGVHSTQIGEIRNRLGIPTSYPHKKVELNLYQHLLGKMPDSEIGNLVGLDRTTVADKRIRLGIPQFKKIIDFKSIEHLLGKTSDRAIGRILGCSYTSIRNYRLKLGIKNEE